MNEVLSFEYTNGLECGFGDIFLILRAEFENLRRFQTTRYGHYDCFDIFNPNIDEILNCDHSNDISH